VRTCVSGKSRISTTVDGICRRQQSTTPGCITSSPVINKQAAGTNSPQSDVVTPRKSACLGGQSLAASAAKRLLARPACRGGRMMPEQPAKQRVAKKKSAARHNSVRSVADENCSNNNSLPEHKSQLHPALPTASQNVLRPATVVNESRSQVNGNVPALTLPRIVIKIHQGRIVSPPANASSMASVGSKKKSAEFHKSGIADAQEVKSSDSCIHPANKSKQVKAQPLPKPAKPTASNKSRRKITSQPTSPKVLTDKNLNVGYFDQSQLQNSGSFDKLSLDCCMKLYGQLNERQTSQPSQSASGRSKSSKHGGSPLKTHSKSPLHACESTRHMADCTKQTRSIPEPLMKLQSNGSVTSLQPNCRVELNRILSLADNGTSVVQVPGSDPNHVDCSVRDKSSCVLEWQSSDDSCNLAIGADPANDCATVTLTPCDQLSTTPRQQAGDPLTATESVPGASFPISKPLRNFCRQTHAVMQNESIMSRPRKKSLLEETVGRSGSCDISPTGLLSGDFNHSTGEKCARKAVRKSEVSLTGSDLTPSSTTACDAVDGNNVVGENSRLYSATADCVRNSRSSLLKNAAHMSIDGQMSDVESSRTHEAASSRKRYGSADYNSVLSGVSSSHVSPKKCRLSETAEMEQLAFDTVDSIPNLSLCSAVVNVSDSVISDRVDVAVLSSDGDWLLPEACLTSDSSTSPLRLRIRRLPDVSPITEMYNVVGQDALTVSAASPPCGMCRTV